MISRNEANRFANVLGVDLHIAQQEVVLLYALKALEVAGVLRRLVFKGGTYLRLMVTGDVGRLSEDLDFTNNGLPADPLSVLTEAFHAPFHGVRFALDDPYQTRSRNWACAVDYQHEWDEGRFRLEISYRETTFLPPQTWSPVPQAYFRVLPFPPPQIPSLRIEEALAEKIRAIQQRATERDLYDALRYGQKGFDAPLVRLLAVAKLWNEREPFDPLLVLSRIQAGRREWPDLDRLIGRGRRRDWNRELSEVAGRFAFLADLTEFEREVLADARRHALRSALESRIASLGAGLAPPRERTRGRPVKHGRPPT